MNSWPQIHLGEVIHHRKEFTEINDLESYKRCRVQLHAKGIVLRDEISGAEIKTKKQQVCRAGEFLVAEIDAKVGGFGIVPQELDGAIVSSHYFLFKIDENLLDRRFLDFYIRTPAFRDQVSAQGSTNYAAIRPKHVLGYTIPLPPLTEQRRIVARIEALAGKIAEARGLRQQAVEETEILLKSFYKKCFGEYPTNSWIPLKSLIKIIENGWSPLCEKRPATDDEWAVLKVGAVSFGKFNPKENKALPVTLKPKPHYEIHKGDFLMSRANTTDLVGACVVVKQTRPKLMLCDKIFRFVFKNDTQIDLAYLDHVLKSPSLRMQIEKKASGTSPTMKNISKEKVFSLFIPNHDIPQQRRIVAYLDALQAKVDALKRLQAETQRELEALLPSVLEKAFRGEL